MNSPIKNTETCNTVDNADGNSKNNDDEIADGEENKSGIEMNDNQLYKEVIMTAG